MRVRPSSFKLLTTPSLSLPLLRAKSSMSTNSQKTTNEEKFPIIDPHHHLWDLDKHSYTWIRGPEQVDVHIAGKLDPIRKNYLLSDYLNDAKNQTLEKSVHVQAECADGGVAEAKWVQEIADEHGFPHGIVAHADLSSPDIEDTLKQLSNFQNVRGIRQLLNWHENPQYRFASRPDYLTDPNWQQGYSLLSHYGLHYELHCYHTQFKDAIPLIQAHPKIQVILNHSGCPIDRDEASTAAWKEATRELAKEKNVAVKISGLGMFDHNFTADSIRPYVLHLIDVFGVDRCMFASNFPVDKLLSDYDYLFNTFREVVKDVSASNQRKLFHDNAKKFYRL